MIFLLIISSILASTWQRWRYPVHKLPRSFAVASQNWRNATKIAKRVSGAELLLTAIAKFNALIKSRSRGSLRSNRK